MAAETINAHNLDAYLRFLSEKTGRDAVPASGTAVWKTLSDDALADALWTHYDALGIPPNRGTAIARAFLQTDEADAVEEEMPVVQHQPLPMSGGYARTRYHAVDPGITTGNYAPYLHWLAAQSGRSLPAGLPGAWAGFNSINIRASLPEAYAAMGISADDAQDYEAEFMRMQHARPQAGTQPISSGVNPAQPVAPVVPQVQATPVAAVPIQAAPVTPPQSFRPAMQQPYVSPRPARRRGRRVVLVAVALVLLGILASGIWVFMKYQEWQGLPTVYPLADNIALRTAPSDDAGMAGRLDLFGRYADKVKGVETSLDQLKLLSATPENDFYRGTPSPSFLSFLTGGDTAVYVHQKYVTDDATSFEEYRRVLAPLRDDLNGLDKLPSAYRRLLVAAFSRSAELRSMNLAVPCRPSAVLSKDAPIPVCTYKSKSTGEITAVFFTTDGRAFTATGVDAEEITTPRVRAVTLDDGGQLTGPGSFKRSGTNTLLFLPCEGVNPSGYPVLGKAPYATFSTQYPVVIDTMETDAPVEDSEPSLLDRILGG